MLTCFGLRTRQIVHNIVGQNIFYFSIESGLQDAPFSSRKTFWGSEQERPRFTVLYITEVFPSKY